MKAYPEYKASGIDWLGEIPSHWGLYKSKHLFSLNSGATLSTEDFVSDGDYPVYGGNGLRGFHDKYNLEGCHILVGRVGALCGNIHYTDEKSWVTEHALILNPIKHFYLHWLGYLLEAMNLRQYSNASAQPVIASSVIGELKLPIPTIDEQEIIAKYLDNKTSRIDALVAEKKTQVEDLRKYRMSLITETVTSGLNPDTPLRFSGIYWLGDIPKHWIDTKLKYLTTKIGSGVTPRGGAEVYQDDGVLFIRSQNVYDDGLHLDEPKYISQEIDTAMEGTRVFNNDVLLNITGASIGRCCKYDLEQSANVNQHVCIIRTIKEKLSPEYIKLLINSKLGQTQISIYQTGGNREGLNFEQLKNFYIPLPPLDEQQQIAEYLDEKTAKIDALIDELTHQIDELALYRKAVISEAVTGKVDVRDWKP